MILFYTISGLLTGLSIFSIDFMSNIVIIGLSFFIGFYMPRNSPIYTSRYELSHDKLILYRIYKKPVALSFREVRAVEVYVKSKGRIPREVIQQERMAIESLRKNGFKFFDYTNTEDIIVLLITEEKVYMISPKEPGELIKKIKKYQSSLKGRLVELTEKGSRVKRI